MDRRLTVACVWMGQKYPQVYVERLRDMVARHLPVPFRFVVISDNLAEIPGAEIIRTPMTNDLPGWWAKMLLLSPEIRGKGDLAYIDLDTVVCGPLGVLLGAFSHPFAICGNFTARAGHPNWPCLYGSCVMTFREGWGADQFSAFWNDRKKIMARCGKYGDQKAIEMVYPYGAILQDMMPPGFFLGRREIPDHIKARPPGCSLVIFAGRHTPENCEVEWIKQEWEK